MSEGMTTNALYQAAFIDRLFNRPLYDGGVHVVTTLHTRPLIPPTFFLRKDPLPSPFTRKLATNGKSLTTKLMIEGINLSTSINHLSYILDNMKQSFFIADVLATIITAHFLVKEVRKTLIHS